MTTIDLEPMRPVKTNIYVCDKQFHLEPLEQLVGEDNEDTYGFIIVDGNGALLGSLQGASRKVLQSFSVDLPKKHGRGGQSALRFARLRLEKRHHYVRKVGELCSQSFLRQQDCHPNVKGLIVAGSAAFKDELLKSKHFDKRLRSIVMTTFDLSYGGSRGFDQAVSLSMETIGSAKLICETHLLGKFLEEVGFGSGMVCYGADDTIRALEMGAVEDLLLWEGLDWTRYTFRNAETDEKRVVHLTREQEERKEAESTKDVLWELVEKEALIDWICEHHKEFGCRLEIVSDRSGIGQQFVSGFGGLGGILRWNVEFYEDDADGAGDHGDDGASSADDFDFGFEDGDEGF